jgi:hypothetical protein
LLYLNHRHLDGLPWRELGASFGRISLATGGMALVILGIGRFISTPLPFLVVGGGAGLLTYLILNLLLGGRELRELLRLLRGRETAV